MLRVLGGLVAPRPLVLVSTLDEHGRPNLAPFSMVLPLSARPAMVGLAIQPRRDGAPKATLANARRAGELVLNGVTLELLRLALECGGRGKRGLGGTTLAASRSVGPPRLLASPAQIECRVSEVLTPAGTTASLVVARVETLHFDRELLDGTADPRRGLVGHLGMAGPGEHLFWTGTGLVRGWVADGQAARFEHVALSSDN
jgi:flavin reductase (DIM6/NTAB) family NADH-FMN oxidoreductase RutF